MLKLKKIGKSSELDITTSLSHIKGKENYRYLIIIKSETTRYAKFIVCPINRVKVLKIAITVLTHIDEHIEIFSRKLQKYIIYSSVLVLISGKIYFECYLDLSLDEEKYKDLKILLDKNKSKFKDIKLEELSLYKNKVNLNGYMEN